MAIINGTYKDQGRNLKLKTNLIDVRVRAYPYIAATVSLDPVDAKFVDVGEWLLLNSSHQLTRPTKDAADASLGTTKSTLAGQVNCTDMPVLAFTARGAADVQTSGKIPVMRQGMKEMELRLWAAEAYFTAGEELFVLFTAGVHAGFKAATGYTGIKGILVPGGLVKSGMNAEFTTGVGATSLWCVGVTTKTTSASAGVIYVDLYATPDRRTITIG